MNTWTIERDGSYFKITDDRGMTRFDHQVSPNTGWVANIPGRYSSNW